MEKYDEKLEEQMEEKYGFNREWLAEGVYHYTPQRLVEKVKNQWPNLTDKEAQYMCGIYRFADQGYFEISNEKTKEGLNSFCFGVKVRDQLIAELMFKYVLCNESSYKDYLSKNKDQISKIDMFILKDMIDNFEKEKENVRKL